MNAAFKFWFERIAIDLAMLAGCMVLMLLCGMGLGVLRFIFSRRAR
jgi:hypothetical protein